MADIFGSAFEYKVLYIFEIRDEKHKGLLKIGDATLHTEKAIDLLSPNCRDLNQAALARIKNYTNTAGVEPTLLHTELAVYVAQKEGKTELKAFRDHDIHRILKNSNIANKTLQGSTSKEWFEIDLETAKKAIRAFKKGLQNLSGEKISTHIPFILRPEQEAAVEQTIKQFKRGNRMLWNAKMRFGKTVCALEVAKRMNVDHTIIITHRPVVNEGWYEDFGKVFYGEDCIYGSKANGHTIEELLDMKDMRFVYFASMQDLRGSSVVGGKFEKNSKVFDMDWDLVIVDEAHEGTTTALGDDVIKNIVKSEVKHDTKFLALSGTPFNILTDYEESEVYTWDYIMEQENKEIWEELHFGDSNPYDELPKLKIYTYDLGKLLSESFITVEDRAFNFHEFFRTWTSDISKDYEIMPDSAKIGDFVHEDDVYSFLNMMTKEDDASSYPYSTESYRGLFNHSLWMVPGVKEAKALKELMMKHPVFGSGAFNIVNVAGDGDEEERYDDALEKVQTAIKDTQLGNYTITLSCGKLTTGVTVREWTAVFMMSGSFSTSAANYLQTIFRVQSPCNKEGMIKEAGYVFDFAPDRTLKMVANAVSVSSKAGKTSGSDKAALGKFLNYCPVISIDGSEMHQYNTNILLQELKKAYADRVVRTGFDDVNLYNDELLKLTDVEIKKFDELKGIIGKSKAAQKVNDITINRQGLTDEEYQELERNKKKNKAELTPEEKARIEELKRLKKLRNDAVSILRGISIRMPLLIYGADVGFDEDVTIDNFTELVDDTSWEEFMPTGITKAKFNEFKKYYDADIFISAGRRIRNIAKSADDLDPTERVKKIASLFSYFKNPDKETVLTPWRVVNMHMSDCLGGYDFFDEEHNDTIEEPRFVDRGDVTREVFGKEKPQILEINSKTGLYPLYITYSIFKMKCKNYKLEELSLEKQRKIWDEVVRDNVFVICKTQMAKSITNRTLCGYRVNVELNAKYTKDLINTMKNEGNKFVKKVIRSSYWNKEGEKMNFDAIVGNPPYQAFLGGASALPVYHHFIEQAIKMDPAFVTMITPARWFNTGTGLGEFREDMLNDDRIAIMHDYMNANDCFSGVEIKGGVEYFLWNNAFHGKCDITTHYSTGEILQSKRNLLEPGMDSYIRDSRVITILNKIRSHGEPSFSQLISARDPFGYDIREEGSFKVKPHQFELKKSGITDVLFYYNGWRNEGIGYVNKNSVNENKEWIDKYKILIPKAWGTGNSLSDHLSPFIAGPNSVCTETYLVVGPFDSKEICENVVSYINTRFFHLLVSILKISQNAARGVYSLVPMQDYLKPQLDRTLYRKYELSDDEISFIENNIKLC